jgi:hypothetical protein
LSENDRASPAAAAMLLDRGRGKAEGRADPTAAPVTVIRAPLVAGDTDAWQKQIAARRVVVRERLIALGRTPSADDQVGNAATSITLCHQISPNLTVRSRFVALHKSIPPHT